MGNLLSAFQPLPLQKAGRQTFFMRAEREEGWRMLTLKEEGWRIIGRVKDRKGGRLENIVGKGKGRKDGVWEESGRGTKDGVWEES